MNVRTSLSRLAPLAGLLIWAAPLGAQEKEQPPAAEMAEMMEAWQKAGQPGEQHQHLAKLVGSWNAEVKFWMDPSGDPMISHGTMDYEMIMGGRYLEEKIRSDFMGQPFQGRGIYGYNNVTGELEAVWIDDMSTGIYTYTGSIDEAGKEIALIGKYQDPMTREWKQSRSEMHLISDTELHYVSYEVQGDQEIKIMEITGTRKGTKQAMEDRTDGGAK